MSEPAARPVSLLRPVSDNDFGALLRGRRAAAGLTQAELAATLGVRAQTVGSWEKGDRPQPRFYGRLAEFLGLGEADVRALLSGAGPAGQPADDAAAPDTADLDPDGALLEIALNVSRRMAAGPLTAEESDIVQRLLKISGTQAAGR